MAKRAPLTEIKKEMAKDAGAGHSQVTWHILNPPMVMKKNGGGLGNIEKLKKKKRFAYHTCCSLLNYRKSRAVHWIPKLPISNGESFTKNVQSMRETVHISTVTGNGRTCSILSYNRLELMTANSINSWDTNCRERDVTLYLASRNLSFRVNGWQTLMSQIMGIF